MSRTLLTELIAAEDRAERAEDLAGVRLERILELEADIEADGVAYRLSNERLIKSVEETEAAESKLAAATALLESWLERDTAEATEAFLAGQPAAPARTEAVPATPAHRWGCDYGLCEPGCPAAEYKARTEAEQRVLEAMGEFKDRWMHEAINDAIETKRGLNPRVAAFVRVFEAELARRGLK